MKKNNPYAEGKIKKFKLTSKILQKNLIGDSHIRDLHVYLPYEYNSKKHYPLLIYLSSFLSSGSASIGWKLFSENIPERLDRLIHSKKIPPTIVAFPDCFTRFGGNQYINSKTVGNYENYLIHEIIPFIEENFNTGGYGFRGCFGKSSGGYGAIIHGMKHPDIWSSIACHSGDMAFELVYLSNMPNVLNELAKHNNSIEDFISHIKKSHKYSYEELNCLMILAMATTYDPDISKFLGIRLPVEINTAELIPKRWDNWLKHDPTIIAGKYSENLKKLKCIFIDCGTKDQYHLQYGSRRLHKKLKSLKIKHIYEEFPDNHSGLDYRFDTSLPCITKVLK